MILFTLTMMAVIELGAVFWVGIHLWQHLPFSSSTIPTSAGLRKSQTMIAITIGYQHHLLQT